MKDVVIVSAARTPIGRFGKSLNGVTAVKLGETAMKEAVARAGISPDQIDEVIFGCVLQAGQGQSVARLAAMGAGIPKEVPSFTINKMCGSGLRSVSLAAQMIKAGDAEIVLAGGTESMTMAPYLVQKARSVSYTHLDVYKRQVQFSKTVRGGVYQYIPLFPKK